MLTSSAFRDEGAMRFAVLGPLEVTTGDGRHVELVSHKLRALLALLVIDAGRVVSLDRIIDQLWGDTPPAAATGTLQAYISQLRRVLEPERRPREAPRLVVTQPPGYVLRATADDVDALQFERLVEEGDSLIAKGDPGSAEAVLSDALALWRGEPFADLAGEPFVQPEGVRLTELRLLALERRLEAWLALGRHAAAAAELESLVAEHPLRERLWALWMTALYRGGRQADALRAFQRCRRTLDEELGLEPGRELRALEQAILRHEPVEGERAQPAASLPRSPRPPVAPAREVGPSSTAGDDAGASADAPLVGRVAPLRRLAARLADACAGRGGLVLLEGEAGIGKTRLAEEVAALAEAEGMTVAWGHAAETAGAPPFWPWVQVVRSLGGHFGPEGSSLAQLLADRLPRTEGDDDPSAARFRLSQALVDLLVETAAKRPLLVVLDDLQWADASSRQFLQFLADDLARCPIVLVATFRPSDDAGSGLEEVLGVLARVRNCERIQLRGLSLDDVKRYLELTGGGGSVSRVAQALHERTDGNPFFLIELIRLLTSEKTVAQLAAADAATPDVPGSVRDVILRRLERLPQDTHTLLRLAAVIGREFDLELLERVAGVDGERLMTLIEPTLVTGLVTESEDSWSCRFSHALVRETLYRSLSRLQRARLHRRVGEALESRDEGAVEAHLDELAHHFHAARPTGTAAKAVTYARRAAEAAGRDLAHDEAVGHWERALGALDPAAPDAPRQRCEILLGLGEARRRVGDLHGARAVLEEAIAVARTLGDRVLIARAACVFGGVTLWNWRAYGEVDVEMVALLEDLLAGVGPEQPQLRAQLLGTLAVELYYSDQKERRERLAAEAVALARPLGEPPLLGRVLNNAFIAQWTPDREDERRAAADEALTWAGRGLPRDAEVIARMHRMWSLLRQGELDLYDADLCTCRRLAAEVRVPDIAGQVLLSETGRAILDGRWGEAEQLAADAYERLSMTTVWGATWCHMVQLFTMRAEQGRLPELVPDLLTLCDEPGGEALRPTAVLALARVGAHDEARRRMAFWGTARAFDWSWDFATAQWAEAAAVLGRPDPATLYEELLPRADRLVVAGTGNTTWGSTHLVLGRLARHLGRRGVALAHFEAAVRHNRRVGARPFEARARFELARLRCELGDLRPRELTALIDPAREIAEHVGMAALLVDLNRFER